MRIVITTIISNLKERKESLWLPSQEGTEERQRQGWEMSWETGGQWRPPPVSSMFLEAVTFQSIAAPERVSGGEGDHSQSLRPQVETERQWPPTKVGRNQELWRPGSQVHRPREEEGSAVLNVAGGQTM